MKIKKEGEINWSESWKFVSCLCIHHEWMSWMEKFLMAFLSFSSLFCPQENTEEALLLLLISESMVSSS